MRVAIILGVCVLEAAAQSLVEPPPLVRLIRRPAGDAMAARRYADAGVALNVIGMSAVTGPAESWLLEAHDAFAGIEVVDRAVQPLGPAAASPADDLLMPASSWVAVYIPGLSYRPDQAFRALVKARYFHVTVVRIRPGTDAEFAEAVRLRRVGWDSINLDRPDLGYRVLSGSPGNTYVFFAPLASLKVLDDAQATLPPYAEPAAKSSGKALAESDISREHLLFRVEPRLSYVSDEFASGDTGFWRGKQ